MGTQIQRCRIACTRYFNTVPRNPITVLHLVSPCHQAANHDTRRSSSDDKRGFTLPEVLIAIAIVAVLAMVAIPMYSDHKDKVRVARATQDILHIQTVVDRWALENRYTYPDSLADVGMGGMVDPWNTPYQYTNVDSAKGKGSARKDRNLVPINTDYDLWSNGPDKLSTPPLTAANSRDDIVRANNGRYVGPAADY